MKHLSRTVLALFLALLMAALLPVQVFADTPDYISEIKVAMGSTANLNGYTVLSNESGKAVDLNQDAGGGAFSKGNKAVYLGYKTTKNKDEAITDIALMNMKGGYSIDDYEMLMETQMKSQIIPFVTDFQVALKEYRANYNSKIKSNKERASYVHDLLNKLTDDDTDGAGLGDLLLNETKFEMGDDAYNALSDEEKKEHADILTIIAQCNGQANLLIYNLITRACDTSDNTWVDRFIDTTYEDMISATGKAPTDARKALSKKYDDTAQIILEGWDALKEDLDSYDEALDGIENADESIFSDYAEKYEDFDVDNANKDEIVEVFNDMTDTKVEAVNETKDASTVIVKNYLESVKYGEGTLLDFFTQDSEDIADDITVLYPLVASLSEGQKTGVEYVSLKELILMTQVDVKTFKDSELLKNEPVSIYEGVDRGIYQKNGVALTSDALRDDAMKITESSSPLLSVYTDILIGISVFSIAGFASTIVAKSILSRIAARTAQNATDKIIQYSLTISTNKTKMAELSKICTSSKSIGSFKGDAAAFSPEVENALKEHQRLYGANEEAKTAIKSLENEVTTASSRANAISGKLIAGVGVAMVIITAITIYFTFKDMAARYKVDLTPIPGYMVDEKDLIGYNSKGEKIILKNQSAYYKAIECNRSESDEFYNTLKTFADMNGDVGAQWLALYAAKNEAEYPIIASSLKAVAESKELPAGYTTGIHMFGQETAFNLNTYPYDWNKEAPSIFVYFRRDEGASAKTTGANFTGGTLALTGGAGILIGAALSALTVTATKKKKENKTVTV